MFTLESTFSSVDKIGAYKQRHISQSLLESMGADLLKGLLI